MKIEKQVNPRFEDFLFDWEQKFQFLVGGYGSSKSYHVVFKIIIKLLEEKRTCLVVRNVYGTIKESCFSLFQEIVEDMGLESKFRFVTSPLEVRFPNGSKVIFRGMDKPEKLKSINNVSLVWVEECSEIPYEGFKELIGRLRHPSLELYMILSTNPVGQSNWTYKHFFRDELNDIEVLDDEVLYRDKTVVRGNTYYHHSTADDNLFLPESYLEQLEEMKEYDPDLYRVARLGQFGVNGIKVLPQFEVMEHSEVMEAVNRLNMQRVGMDFGFETSYNAALQMAIDHDNKYLYIHWEYYKNKMTDDKTAVDERFQELKGKLIRAESAEPKTIQYYNQSGYRMVAAKKPTKIEGIKKVKRFKRIICSDRCPNTIRELKNLTFKKDRNGNIIEDEFDIDAHTFDAIKYGLDGYEVADIKEKGRPSGVRRKR